MPFILSRTWYTIPRLSLILKKSKHVFHLLILIGWTGAAFFSYTRETDEGTTPDVKNDRRANSFSYLPLSTWKRSQHPNDLLELSTPECRLRRPHLLRHSIVLPIDNLKVCAGWGDGGIKILSMYAIERKKVVNTRNSDLQTVWWKNDGSHVMDLGCFADFFTGTVGVLGTCEQLQARGLNIVMCMCMCVCVWS